MCCTCSKAWASPLASISTASSSASGCSNASSGARRTAMSPKPAHGRDRTPTTLRREHAGDSKASKPRSTSNSGPRAYEGEGYAPWKHADRRPVPLRPRRGAPHSTRGTHMDFGLSESSADDPRLRSQIRRSGIAAALRALGPHRRVPAAGLHRQACRYRAADVCACRRNMAARARRSSIAASSARRSAAAITRSATSSAMRSISARWRTRWRRSCERNGSRASPRAR